MQNVVSFVEYEVPKVVEFDHVLRIIYAARLRNKSLYYLV